jgi:hypothetical protein
MSKSWQKMTKKYVLCSTKISRESLSMSRYDHYKNFAEKERKET